MSGPRGVDPDVGIVLLEGADQRLHADTVAAAEEVPPNDLRLGLRDRHRSKGQSGHGRRHGQSFPHALHLVLPGAASVVAATTPVSTAATARSSLTRTAKKAGRQLQTCLSYYLMSTIVLAAAGFVNRIAGRKSRKREGERAQHART